MPKPRPSIEYNITALVADGTIRLSGDILNDIVEVTSTDTAIVNIADTADSVLYAAVTSTAGVPGCWGRDASGSTKNFGMVTTETFAIVYAVSRSSAKGVTYGPVITIKPKG